MSSENDPVDSPASAPSDQPSAGVVWQRDVEVASSLVDAFTRTRASQAELDAFVITTLSAAAGLVAEQTSRTHKRAADAELPERIMVAELATAGRVSERTVRRQLAEAADLCARFAATVTALREGRISRAHVAVIHDAGYEIDDDTARAGYEAAAIGRAETTTPGRLRPVAEVLAARANPRSIDERHNTARKHRAVRVVDLADGMADLITTVPATLAHAALGRLTQQAQLIIDTRHGDVAGAGAVADGVSADVDAEPVEPDARSLDEVRADVLCDVLLTGTPDTCVAGDALSAIRATVQVTVPVLTAAGTGTEPAVLAGYGPIDTDTARHLAGGAKGWERVMTSPVTGTVLHVDRYRPGKHLKRFLRARDERCRFPGCRMPVRRCDQDHTIDFALGGPTTPGNMGHLCKNHHTVKHSSPWRVRQLSGGVLEWTSATGRTYTDHPEPTLRFVPEPGPHLQTRWRTAEPDDPIWRYTPHGEPPPF